MVPPFAVFVTARFERDYRALLKGHRTLATDYATVVGVYAIYIESAFHHDVGVALHTLSVKLADTPVGPLGYDRPRDVVRRQLSAPTSDAISAVNLRDRRAATNASRGSSKAQASQFVSSTYF
jgi:hypothetical protein